MIELDSLLLEGDLLKTLYWALKKNRYSPLVIYQKLPLILEEMSHP
jgi:hypothetical protein